MLEPNTDSTAAQPPLPLFRPEVLAAQQQKFYGDVLLIRPFSAAFFILLGIFVAGAILGVLLLGRQVEKPSVAPVHQQSATVQGTEAK